MDYLTIFLIILFGYLFMIFFLTRILVPHMGYRKDILPDKISEDLNSTIVELRKGCKGKEDYLHKAFNFVTSRYKGGRLLNVLHVPYLFKDIDWVCSRKGFMPCNHQNHLLRILLVKGGFFEENEIRIKHTFLNFDIHQYIQVRIKDRWISVDPWSAFIGKKIGEHASLFC